MKITKDTRLSEFKKIERLLYGINYQVWLNLYGPLDPNLGLEQTLKNNVSNNAQLSDVIPSSPKSVKEEIKANILYQGDINSGPINLENKREKITSLLDKIFSLINIDEADLIVKFAFKKGHPAYPVFWDFSYDIHSNTKRWIFIGSSSD